MGTRVEEVKAKGVDVVVAVDVSNSMMAEDLKPNRMEVAKRALAQLIDRMGGDRLGIVVFAGQAYTQLPITADRSAAKALPRHLGPGHGGTPRNRDRCSH
ncbi:MAG: VWA domain-containing protein [Flavobacteriales bacterium]|jgi:Ca-activated chloride channel family protein|nr:VWA domain-containing protein [Flavobacteriales bacterium]